MHVCIRNNKYLYFIRSPDISVRTVLAFSRKCKSLFYISITQCDEMKIFGQNLKILSNRIIWAPIDREKSIFEKKMSRSPFLTTQNTSFSKIHNFCKVQLFSKRFSDYDREFPVLFYKNKKIIFGRPEDSHFLT